MAITAFKTFVTGEVLLAADLNSSFSRNLDQINVNTVDIATNVTAIALNTTAAGQGSNRGKNFIINGDFQDECWQRGTTQSANGYGSADRWNLQLSGATGSFSQQTHTLGQTVVPNNPEFFGRLDITSGNADASVQTRIEGVATAASQVVMLSFYAKSAGTLPTGFKARLTQSFGTGGSPSSDVSLTSSAFTLTTAFQRFTFTTTLASISGKTLGSTRNNYLAVVFINTANEVFELDISNVQLEIGAVATDFEVIPPAEQLARCYRYFERQDFVNGSVISTMQATSTTAANGDLQFSRKRAIPVVTETGGGTVEAMTSTFGSAGGTLTFINTSENAARLNIASASSLTAGNASLLFVSTGVGTIEITSEL